MAAAIVVPDSVVVGTPITLTGTGFANTTAYTAEFSNPEETGHAVFKGASSGGGAIAFATDGGVFTPQVGGVFTVRVVCGSDTLESACQVFAV